MYHEYLLALAEQGNVEAYWALTEQHLGGIFNKVWFLSGSVDETRRIMRRGLVRACLQLQQERGRGKRSFPAFLSRTVVGTALATVIGKRGRPGRPLPRSSLDRELEAGSGRLLAWFRQLDRLQRGVVVLRYFEGLGLQEIAAVLGKNEARVGAALLEALQSFEE
jgi:DNA-directed RNA polymerase specialized sigma24 family protein